METKLKQEPVADGGGLPEPYVVTKEDEEQAKVVPSEIARPFVAKLVACERALASSQEALRAAREENEQLKRTINHVAGGAAQGMMMHAKAQKALSPEGSSQRHCDYKNCSLPHGHIQSCNELDSKPEGSSR